MSSRTEGPPPGPVSAATRLPPASLIIPSVNRAQLLIETIDSILAGEDVPAEIIVVDQSERRNESLVGRTDPRCDVRYVHTDQIGVSLARNTGIQLARHPLLGFTDDDIRVEPDWFRALVRAAVTAGPRAVVTGRVLPEKPATADGFVPSTITEEEPVAYAGRIGIDIMYSNNMMLHRSAFDEIGAFDVRLGGGSRYSNAEDNDLGHRLLEAGYRILYTPEAVVHHRAWRTRKDYLPLRWSYARGQGAFYAKHLDLRDPYMVRRIWDDVTQSTLRLLRVLPRDRREAAGQIVHLGGLATALADWLVTRPKES